MKPNSKPDMMQENCEDVAARLKLLAHPQRLMILCHLSDGEKTVSELEALCSASQSAVSQFLNRMKSEGLVDSERDGNFVRYKIADKRINEVVKSLYKIYCN